MHDGGEVAIRWATRADDLRGAFELRDRVFCGEQGVPRTEELDGLDEAAEHLVALAPGTAEVIGTLRLLVNGASAKIGRVAVERDWRGRGIASRMLKLALVRAREQGCEEARLAAQLAATQLYADAGFTVQSGTFEEAGIPHVWMTRPLVESP